MNTPIPALSRACNSWIVTSPRGTVTEIWGQANIQRASQAGYRIETAGDYLARVNAQIKGESA